MSERDVGDWLELVVQVPTAAQDAVVAWLLDRGADGVQEDYPGLYPAGDGPVVSGDPSEWWGEAPRNDSGEVILTAWLPKPTAPEVEAEALRRFLREIDTFVPGVAEAPVTVRVAPDQDWNAHWKASWKPTPIGERLLICPSWEEPPETERVVMRIDPGMAFGTGTHFTTASCLGLIEGLTADPDCRPRSLLDVGTGTGILAIGGLLLGIDRATGIDVDPEAVAEARENALRNGVGERLTVTSQPLAGDEGRFDVVVANLVAHTLLRLARPICRAVAPGGSLIVSGVLLCHEEAVDAAIRDHGLTPWTERRDDSWVTLMYNHLGGD
jgi:ribosomal protein L11 methyltransferase